MQRDPTIIGRTNVMAETFAGVINSFVEAISWKTMVRQGRSVLASYHRADAGCAGFHSRYPFIPHHPHQLGALEP